MPARPVNGPVFLTGFMATGKTKVGRLLARRMGRRFIDTDDMVEERAGMTIAEDLLRKKGRAWFRDLEHACVVEVASRGDVVVALGGGAITQDRNRDAIRESPGLLVCLQADLETILERVSRKETRPSARRAWTRSRNGKKSSACWRSGPLSTPPRDIDGALKRGTDSLKRPPRKSSGLWNG